MTNKTVIELAEINDTSCEVRRRRLNWLVHILRREGENDCCTALGCAFSVYASKLSNSLPLKLKKQILVRSIHLRISLKSFFLTVHFANIYYFLLSFLAFCMCTFIALVFIIDVLYLLTGYFTFVKVSIFIYFVEHLGTIRILAL